MKKQLLTTCITESPEETESLGRMIGQHLDTATVALSGDLGAGKTLMSRSICLGASIDPDMISSPTFTLINQYRGGRVLVHHMDTYRLDPESFIELGIDEIIAGEGLKLIEWADRIEDHLPEDTLFILLEHEGESRRRLQFYSHDDTWRETIDSLLARAV
jgi:tRNA threonylcarbamoyladenosine biosynthesis protein TsaE